MNFPADQTALMVIGFQNDFLSPQGALSSLIEQNVAENRVMENTTALIDSLLETDVLIINTPILFSKDYSEMNDPSGLMATIKEFGAFGRETWGGDVHPAIQHYEDRIIQFKGKTRFNGFHSTDLDNFLTSKKINHVVIAGVLTSLCVDSTARAASDLGYSVSILTDCSAARTKVEHEFYCESIFPLYAIALTSKAFLASLNTISTSLAHSKFISVQQRCQKT